MRAFLLAASALWATGAFAQPPPPPAGRDLLRVDGGISLQWGHGTRTYGLGGVVEPKYYPVERLGVGLRLEGGVRLGGRAAGESGALRLFTTTAALAKAELLLGEGGVRPFLGFGAGSYSLSGQGAGDGGLTLEAGRFFGLAPQAGVDLGELRVALTYNALFGSGGATSPLSRDYLGLEVSFTPYRLKKSASPPADQTPEPPASQTGS